MPATPSTACTAFGLAAACLICIFSATVFYVSFSWSPDVTDIKQSDGIVVAHCNGYSCPDANIACQGADTLINSQGQVFCLHTWSFPYAFTAGFGGALLALAFLQITCLACAIHKNKQQYEDIQGPQQPYGPHKQTPATHLSP